MDRRRSPIAILQLLAIWGVWIGGCAWPLKAQNRIEADPGRALTSSDLAVLEAREPRDDLPCRVTPVKPSVGFDLKFQQYQAGELFCREVSEEEGLDFLNLAWKREENLPTYEEILHPFLWMERMKGSEGKRVEHFHV